MRTRQLMYVWYASCFDLCEVSKPGIINPSRQLVYFVIELAAKSMCTLAPT